MSLIDKVIQNITIKPRLSEARELFKKKVEREIKHVLEDIEFNSPEKFIERYLNSVVNSPDKVMFDRTSMYIIDMLNRLEVKEKELSKLKAFYKEAFGEEYKDN